MLKPGAFFLFTELYVEKTGKLNQTMKLSMYYTAGIKFWCEMELSNYPFDKQARKL